MTSIDTTDTGAPAASCPPTPAQVARGFNVSVIVSGIRCTLSYVVLPFVVPFLGLAPGVGPGLGIAIGVVAIAANLWSIRRFWQARHPWRRVATAVHVGIIAFLGVLLVLDVGALTG
ncbi:MAG: hypothetical protein R3290_05040 [Acidimicrobiia bacterium]|nr:hypothetical protein [Acidimicrobiia bacterium]